jgi:hypothetical protein
VDVEAGRCAAGRLRRAIAVSTSKNSSDASQVTDEVIKIFKAVQQQLQVRAPDPFERDETRNAVNVFNDVLAGLRLVFPPERPVLRKAEAVPGPGIQLDWTYGGDLNNLDGFRVMRCKGAGCTDFVVINQPISKSATSHVDSYDLEPNTDYRYRISAYNLRYDGYSSPPYDVKTK